MSAEVKIRFNDCDPIGHLNNVKYLDYMLNAREDHVEANYHFNYEEYAKKTGHTWIAIQNEIAYLKEVKANTKVIITSKTIEITDRTCKVEILMKSEDQKLVYAVLWTSAIYFDLKTRKSASQPQDIKQLFHEYYVDLEQKDFQSRVLTFRKQNKLKHG